MLFAGRSRLAETLSTMAPRAKKDGGRGLRVRVRTKGLKASSSRWLERQLNDPYVAEAKRQGYRSRAAFKLVELDDKFRLLKKNATVLDLGAAPGGWSQVARQRVGAGGRVVGADILEMQPIEGVDLLTLDMLSAEAPAAIRAALGGPADVVCPTWLLPPRGTSAPIRSARPSCSNPRSRSPRACSRLEARLSARCSRAARRPNCSRD